jgi:hypothetical protein
MEKNLLIYQMHGKKEDGSFGKELALINWIAKIMILTFLMAVYQRLRNL